jgi:Fur family peroxide stress response transcriptional regulator
MKIFECAGKRYRMTPQRQAVLDVLRGTNTHPDAAWVHEEVRKVMPNISLATVHRTLSLLREAGFIPKTDAGDHDDARTEIHCRARCVSCSRTVDVRIDAAADLPVQAASATGFVITGQRLDLTGFCPDCAQERETNQS